MQVADSPGAHITITYQGMRRWLPLERALVALDPDAAVAPSRLLRARAAEVPWTVRDDVLNRMRAWMDDPAAASVRIVGGGAGTGKTRLGVRLCEQYRDAGWVAGLLRKDIEAAQIEALCDLRVPRVVVVDYAETRGVQLAALVPYLYATGAPGAPVRILLLVRKAAPGGDWKSSVLTGDEALQACLDVAQTVVLDSQPLGLQARKDLCSAAVDALAKRLDTDPPAGLPDLTGDVFATPLMVVFAGFLAVKAQDVPTGREDLLAEVLAHEAKYWERSAAKQNLTASPVLRARSVGLATLTTATDEQRATDTLRLLRDLSDADAERCGDLARWIAAMYPGPTFWNPVEPDALGEYLVSRTLSEVPGLATTALAGADPVQTVHVLDVLARATVDYLGVREAACDLLGTHLTAMVTTAVKQAAHPQAMNSLTSRESLPAALARLLDVVAPPEQPLRDAHSLLPPRPDLYLGPLTVALGHAAVDLYRALAQANPDAYTPDLASSVNNYAIRLAEAGRRQEGLEYAKEAVDLYRALAQANPAAYTPDLAMSVNNYANRLAEAGRRQEGLEYAKEAVDLYRALAQANPAAYGRYLEIAERALAWTRELS